MAYRDFTTAPRWARTSERDASDTDNWLEWLVEQRVLHDYVPFPDNACEFCGGPVAEDGVGGYWQRCYNCNQARNYVDELVAASFSLDNGLESLVRAYKDFGHEWTAAPLATLLWETIDRHGDCLRAAAGRKAIFTWVPSDDESRSFDHIERLLTSVGEPSEFDWRGDVVARNRSAARPGPGSNQVYIAPDAYSVRVDVDGRTIVLLDDLWTSGASMASTAAALRAAGAARVIGIVLGRQLKRGSTYGNSAHVFDEAEGRTWAFTSCALCA